MNIFRCFIFSALLLMCSRAFALAAGPGHSQKVHVADCSAGFPQLPLGYQSHILQNISGKHNDQHNAELYINYVMTWFRDYEEKWIIFGVDETLLTGPITRPVYPNIMEVFTALESQGWKIFAISTRKHSQKMAYDTFADLEAVGLSPWFKPLNKEGQEIDLESDDGVLLQEIDLGGGVIQVGNLIFTSSKRFNEVSQDNKGVALHRYLTSLNRKPGALIFADNTFIHNQEISTLCAANNIPSVALHFCDAELEKEVWSGKSGNNSGFGNISEAEKHIFTTSSDGMDIFYTIKSFLMNLNKDTIIEQEAPRHYKLFIDYDDTLVYGTTPNGESAALLYPEIPRIFQELKTLGFSFAILTDREADSQMWGEIRQALEDNKLLQAFGLQALSPFSPFGAIEPVYEPYRDGFISPLVLHSSCKITREKFGDLLYNHCKELQRKRPRAHRNFIQAYSATKAHMVHHHLRTNMAQAEQIVIFIEDSQTDCEEVFKLLKELGVPCLVIQSTQADKLRKFFLGR
jgi:hypothetical protein